MYATYLPAVYTGSYVRPAQLLAPSPLWMGVVGALTGGTYAAATNMKRVQQDAISTEEAIRQTLKTGVNMGLATAAATVVAGMLGHERSWLTLVAMLATGGAVMYLLEE